MFSPKGWISMTRMLAALFFLSSTALAVQITEFGLPSPASGPTGIVSGPDGALWFTERNADKIGRITTDGVVTEFPLAAGAQPTAITVGPDGALWFVESGAGRLGRMTTSGAVTEFSVGPGSVLLDVVAGPDGNIWYASELLVPGPGPLGRIGQMTPLGTFSEFSLPFPARVASSLAAGPDGNIWFAGYGLASFGSQPFGVVGAVSTSGDGVDTFSLGAGMAQDIAAGPDGNLWFTMQIQASSASTIGRLGRIVPTPPSQLTEFSIPAADSVPSAIASGPDGALWFTDLASAPRLGRATTDGAITELAAPSAPGGIVGGPDGAVWLTEPGPGKIARVSALSTVCTPSATALCLDDGRFSVEATWTKSDGTSGAATPIPLGSTSTAGYFWFFSPETPEVMFKMLEGCAFNGYVWFFAGGLTNVRVDVKVTDMTVPNGAASKTYTNPLGTAFTPIQDTAAFPCHASLIPPPPNP
jgi:virginiamycin B lyase